MQDQGTKAQIILSCKILISTFYCFIRTFFILTSGTLVATLLPFPLCIEVFGLLPTFLVFFSRGCGKVDHRLLRSFLQGFPTSWPSPSPQHIGEEDLGFI